MTLLEINPETCTKQQVQNKTIPVLQKYFIVWFTITYIVLVGNRYIRLKNTFNFVNVLQSVKKSKISGKWLRKSSDAPVGILVTTAGNVGTILSIAVHSGNIPPISLKHYLS